MNGIFDRYHECKELVDSMPECVEKEHIKLTLTQLLHIEQARKVAHDGYNRYRDEMNSWETNLVRDIKYVAECVKEATNE